MFKSLFITITIFAAAIGQAFASDWQYYRRDSSLIQLTPCESLVTIQFTNEGTNDQILVDIRTGTALRDDYEPVDVGQGFWQFAVDYGCDLVWCP